jgi:hypothetical protein
MKYKFFFIFMVFISCSLENKDVSGNYVSHISKFDLIKGYFNKKFYATGTSLNIKKDSTYYLQTCGNIIEGKWKRKDDSLLLFKYSNKYRIDSLNNIPEWKIKLIVNPQNPDIYLINGDKIILKSNFLNSKYENHKMIIKLKKQ